MNKLPKPLPMTVMRIDCNSCQVRYVECDDCVVAALIGAPTELSREDISSIQILSDSGLVPPLRLVVDDDSDVTE
jgi:hypothetical protein